MQTYQHTDVLVLGHGAGMLHTLWLKPGALVVEIIPRKKNADVRHGAVQGCRRLAGLTSGNLSGCPDFGFRLERVVVEGAHAEVDVARVVDVVGDYLENVR